MSLTEEQLKIVEVLSELDLAYSFPEVDKMCSTYLEECEKDIDSVWKLSFSTIPELIDILETKKRGVKSKKCDVLCAVEVFKNKPQYSEKKLNNMPKAEMEMPEYIYNF